MLRLFKTFFKLFIILITVFALFLALTGRLNEMYLGFLRDAIQKAVYKKDFSELKHLFDNDYKKGRPTKQNTNVEEEFIPTNKEYKYTAKASLTQGGNMQFAKKEGSFYHFKYIFKGAKDRPTLWNWKFPKRYVDKVYQNYGLPKNFFKASYTQNEMQRILKKSMFRSENGMISTDYNAVLRNSKAFGKPMYDMILQKLGRRPTQFDLIKETLRFCQDIPYKTPQQYYNDRYTWGFFPPSTAIALGFADCDSKCVIFSSILAHNKNIDLIYITVPGHLLLGIRGIPNAYQKYVTYQGQKYILCEPVGPARLSLGTPGANYSRIKRIEKVKAN